MICIPLESRAATPEAIVEFALQFPDRGERLVARIEDEAAKLRADKYRPDRGKFYDVCETAVLFRALWEVAKRRQE